MGQIPNAGLSGVIILMCFLVSFFISQKQDKKCEIVHSSFREQGITAQVYLGTNRQTVVLTHHQTCVKKTKIKQMLYQTMIQTSGSQAV